MGNLDILFHLDNKAVPVNLENALVAPGIRCDLFPPKAWDRSGGEFRGKGGAILLLGRTMRLPIRGGSYRQLAYEVTRNFWRSRLK